MHQKANRQHRTLTNEVAAWMKRRNENKKKINWKFTKKNADEKLSKYYVP